MKLSEHFTLDELCASDTARRQGIDNAPPQELLPNLQRLANSLERVRAALGGDPLIVSSGYRCAALNRLVGGAATSAHLRGLAADVTQPGVAPRELARRIGPLIDELGIDQLIVECERWVHIGLCDGKPRRQLLTYRAGGGYTVGIA